MARWLGPHRLCRRLSLIVICAIVALSGGLPWPFHGLDVSASGWLPGPARVAEAASTSVGPDTERVHARKNKVKRRRGDRSEPSQTQPPTQSPSAVESQPQAPAREPPAPILPVACAPRPPVHLLAEPALLPEPGIGLPGRDALLITLTTRGAAAGIRNVVFTTLTNALVEVADGGPRATPFAIKFAPGQQPTVFRFTLWRPDQTQGSWLRLTVGDGCGQWNTFAGRGPG